jgi:hypothetical protein
MTTSATEPPEPDGLMTITTGTGQWRIGHHRASGSYHAAFHHAASGRPVWRARADSSWALESEIGIALPLAAHTALAVTDTGGPPSSPATSARSTPPAGSRPARHHRMRFAGTEDTYGRIMHDHPPIYTWTDGPYRLEILGVTEIRSVRGPARRFAPDGSFMRHPIGRMDATLYAYRISHHDQIILTRANLAVRSPMPVPGSLLTPMAVVGLRADTPRTPYQRRWAAEHGETLTRLTRLPHHPLPPGTRVRVELAARQRGATGTVVRAVHDPNGRLTAYTWRPHAWDQPGHRFADQPDEHLTSPVDDVQATLDSPERPGFPAYRARVATIDHKEISSGTVLRTRLDNDQRLEMEIQPDQPDHEPVWLPERDVTVTAGALWSTVADLTAARAHAGLPLLPNEPLLAVRDFAVTSSGFGHRFVVTATVPTELQDPVLNPADPPAGPTVAPPSAPPPGL